MDTEFTVTLSSKGQLTLPAEVRRRAHLDTGDRLRLTLRDDGTLELTKPTYAGVDDIVGVAGSLDEPRPWHEVREIAREERAAEVARRKVRP
ncbi:MAG TPA: AbrB/MazE/SpoVT family DNA-binding domain-containing protein [Thermomicrobiales bacterium]|nr:AbrB/MazE/SpoVT family DNA-binding domain-containing protein [Thermomicrobiales bacterium]